MSKRKTSTSNKMPWFKFYTADFITTTLYLSAAERGTYVDLFRLFWEYGSLPDDLDKIRVKMLPCGEQHHSRIKKWIRKILEQCFQQTDDGSWYNPGFGDHHLSVSRTDKVVSRTDKVVSRTDKSVGWEGVLSSEINAPSPQEQNREEQEHTHKSMCGNGKDKQEEPTPDSGDDDPEIMEIFRALADPPSRYRSLSPDGDPTNGHGPNGHNRTSPTTDDLDHAVETYLAAYPMTTGKPDLVRQELAKVPFDQVMAGLSYHKSYIWRTKGDRWIPDPENFLINGTWKKGRRPGSPADLLQDTTRRMGNDDGCDDGSDRACG